MRVLTSWFRRTDPTPLPATPVAVPRDLPTLATPPAWVEQTTDWFADEPTEMGALAQATLAALIQARPQPVDATVTVDERLAWLDEAFARLATLPTPPAAPSAGDAPSWRYLVFTRVLCDALEAAYTIAGQTHQRLHCPLTTVVDPYRAARPLIRPNERARPPHTGLGALLAGVWLPEAGQRHLLQALAQGIDWVNATAFWDAHAKTLIRKTPTPASPSGADDDTADQPTSGSEADAQPVDAAHPDADLASAATTPLEEAFHAAVQALIQSDTFNRQNGDGWNSEGVVWVAAKPFAERLLDDPWVQTQPALQHRKALYHRLARQGLIRAHGAAPVWAMYIVEPGQKPRYASVLKLSSAQYATLKGGTPYGGSVQAVSDSVMR